MRLVAFLFFALAAVVSATAAGADGGADVLALMKKYRVKPESAGVWIQRVGDDLPLMAHNVDAPLNPASVIKLITGWAAINKHGAKHLFRTELRHSGKIQKGELNGDLYCRRRRPAYYITFCA